MRVFQMLEEKAPAPEYGTYQYSALADNMGIGMRCAVACVQRAGSAHAEPVPIEGEYRPCHRAYRCAMPIGERAAARSA